MALRTVLSPPRTTRRLLVGGVAAAVVSGLLVAASPASATVSPQLTRLAGQGRYETSALVSAAAFADDQAPDVVVASGATYPDGLAASALAGQLHGPVLLVPPHGPLPVAVTAELHRLGAVRATVVGGTSAVGTDVQSALVDLGLTVTRISGADRYETAAAVADEVFPDANVRGMVFLASGVGFADALAASGVSYALGIPILLTPPDDLSPGVAGVLGRRGGNDVQMLGGPESLSPLVQDQLTRLGIGTGRLFGADRGATASAIAEWARSSYGFGGTGVVVADGNDFPDALSAGALAGRTDSPVLYGAGASTDYYLRDHRDTVDHVVVVGGSDAVPATRASSLLDDATAQSPSLPHLVSSTPGNGFDGYPYWTRPTATFSAAVPTGSHGQLLGPDLQPVPSTWSVDGATITISPLAPLQERSTYEAVFTLADTPQVMGANSSFVRFVVYTEPAYG